MQQEDLLTIREVAKRLRVSETTTRRWVTSGTLEAIALPHKGHRSTYRIKRSVLDKILQGGRKS